MDGSGCEVVVSACALEEVAWAVTGGMPDGVKLACGWLRTLESAVWKPSQKIEVYFFPSIPDLNILGSS